MNSSITSKISGILSFFLFPYLMTIFFNGVDTALLNPGPDVEWYLPVILSGQIDADDCLETVKAQAVIARTNLYYRFGTNISVYTMFREMKNYLPPAEIIWKLPAGIYEKAVKETKNQVLTFEEQLQMIPYHAVSNGKTRDGTEVFHDEKYAYLTSVESSGDKESADYLNSTYVGTEQLPRRLCVETKDSAGYITEVSADGTLLGGEQFRLEMGLTSSDFSVQKIGGRYRFLCKGKGHGLGFSQYGGNELAKSGMTCQRILETYFPEMKIQNIKGVYFAKSE